jgi:hypothetical protein
MIFPLYILLSLATSVYSRYANPADDTIGMQLLLTHYMVPCSRRVISFASTSSASEWLHLFLLLTTRINNVMHVLSAKVWHHVAGSWQTYYCSTKLPPGTRSMSKINSKLHRHHGSILVYLSRNTTFIQGCSQHHDGPAI